MELPELQQGLQNIQQADIPQETIVDTPIAAPVEAPWLSMDNLMSGYGNWFNNDKGLGEMLLSQLRSRGVDTQAATEAMLRELLQGLVDDLNMLQQQLTGFTSAINQQMQQTQAVADSVQGAISSQSPSPAATEILPPTGAQMPTMNDMPPPDTGTVPPVDTPPAGDMPPPDTGTVPPVDTPPVDTPPAGDMPTPDTGTVPPPDGTVSDARVKKIRYVLSDASMKKIKTAIKNKNKSKLTQNIISACRGGY